MRLNAPSLELPAIGVADLVPAEHTLDVAREQHVRHIAVRALGGRADEGGVRGGFQIEAGLLRLADGVPIDEHDNLASIARLAVRLYGLVE